MLVGRRGCARGGGAVRYRAVSEDDSESTASIAGSAAADDDFVDDRLVYDEEDGDGEDRVTGGDGGGGGAGSYESFDACCRDLLLTSGPHAAPSSTHLRPSTGIEEAAAAWGSRINWDHHPPPSPRRVRGLAT